MCLKLKQPSERASTLSDVLKFLSENMARYLSNNDAFSSRRIAFKSSIFLIVDGGAGSTEKYGLLDNFCDEFFESFSQFILVKAN